MNDKYTPAAITEALKEWEEYKNDSVDLYSIKSRLIDPNSKTVFLLNKKYPLYDLKLMPSHMFTVVDGKIFHPGSIKGAIYDDKETRKSYLVSLEEKCFKCTYHHMANLFKRDQQFHILVNNCQIVMGQYFETVLLFLMFGLMAAYAIFGYIAFIICAGLIFTFIVIVEKMSSMENTVVHTTCPHIKTVNQIG